MSKKSDKAEAHEAAHEAKVMADFQELVIEGDHEDGLVVGGLFDGLLSRLLGTIKFDWHKIDPKELKAAVQAAGDGMIGTAKHVSAAIKPAVDVLGGVDDIAIDKALEYEIKLINAMVAMALHQIDVMFPQNGLFMAEPPMTVESAQAWIDSLTSDEVSKGLPITMHNAVCIEKIRSNPEVVRVLKRLPRKKQLRAVTDPTFLDKILELLVKYGPFLLQIFLMFI